jgi:hypothetical protein
MKAIAMLPSPTAAATRLTGLDRTSPQQKIISAVYQGVHGAPEGSPEWRV